MRFLKLIIFSFIPFLVLTLLLEIGGRVVYFQSKCPFPTFVSLSFHKAQQAYFKYRAAREASRIEGIQSDLFWDEKGRSVRESFMAKYRADFDIFIREVEGSGSRLMVVFMPSDDYKVREKIISQVREFFTGLTNSRGIPFLDLTETFYQYPASWVMLLPENGHLSRFGNQLAAKEILSFIDKNFGAFRSSATYLKRPKLFGDLAPSQVTVNDTNSLMPYRLVTNKQGLRMGYEIRFPKKQQRVLMLGDSFTYGPFLHDQDTLSVQLTRMDGSREFINAGVSGYTLKDELGLFIERAKYVEPDIVILQVLENDINGYASSLLNEFARDRKYYALTKEEKEFLKKEVQDRR